METLILALLALGLGLAATIISIVTYVQQKYMIPIICSEVLEKQIHDVKGELCEETLAFVTEKISKRQQEELGPKMPLDWSNML